MLLYSWNNYLCRFRAYTVSPLSKTGEKALAAEGIIAVGSVDYALSSGIIVASPTFGRGLMAVGVGIAVLHTV